MLREPSPKLFIFGLGYSFFLYFCSGSSYSGILPVKNVPVLQQYSSSIGNRYVSMEVEISLFFILAASILFADCSKYLLKRSFLLWFSINFGSGSSTLGYYKTFILQFLNLPIEFFRKTKLLKLKFICKIFTRPVNNYTLYRTGAGVEMTK